MLFAFAIAVVSPLTVRAADEVVTFDNPDHKQMYQMLLREYRCLKCQNQNLWDSNASLAGDLRREIRDQIIDGKSKADIDEYLVARYGEFVLYRPRLNATTAILWIGPFVLLLVGLVSLVVMVRNKSSSVDRQTQSDGAAASKQYSADKLSKARKLLDD
ncbi:MAG: cytochrome c-type biogenesis protein [Granulosicoccus sp.]